MAADQNEAFFVVLRGEPRSTHDTDFQKADGSTFGDAPRCEDCDRPIGMRRWLPPFRAELELYGSQWGDFAFFGPAQFLLSERAAEALQDEKISGLAGFEPVEIVKVRGPRPVPSYLHAEVSLGGAATDEAKSSITRAGEIACARCRSGGLEAIHGFTIEDGTWTREDIFVLRDLPGVLVATARFKDVVSRHRLTNIRFVATERYEWDARPTRGA